MPTFDMTAARSLTTLKTRREFLRVKGGPKWNGAGFLLDCRPAERPGPARFGFTVTKKLGNAVVRNRIRRRLREAVKRVQGEHARADFDYVMVARGRAFDLPFETLCRDVMAALAHVHRASAPGKAAKVGHGPATGGQNKG